MVTEHQGRPRLEDVAREAGVSPSTASRVLNGSARKVADTYRERVVAAAARIGYATNLAAQATARGHYPAIGLVVGDIRDNFFGRITAGVLDEAARQGLPVNLFSAQGDPDRERELISQLRRQRPQYLVLVRKRDNTASADSTLLGSLRDYEREGGRVAVVGETGHAFSTVEPPDMLGGKALARTLLGLGYRSCAALVRDTEIGSSRDRLDGLRIVLSAAGVALPDDRVIRAEQSVVGGIRAATELLTRCGRDGLPEVVIGLEDALAYGAVEEFRRNGIAVPDDIAVAGYGGRDLERDTEAGRLLTTVVAPLEEMGRIAVLRCVDPDSAPAALPEPAVLVGPSTPARS